MSVEMVDLLDLVVSEGCSDLHLEVGAPPMIRLHGDMVPLEAPVLKKEDTERLIKSITSDYHQKMIKEEGTVDLGFDFGGKARFRVSAFKQKSVYGAVLRLISNDLLTLEKIGLPVPIIKELLYRPRGLILVTGPTGSGKSTTLASMINVINMERAAHIITIEDPIEFYHQHKKSIVMQREVGTDVTSFAEALRRALRQDPDVILVGEMRDMETIGAAVTAAETGHLVFGTLHTVGAAPTVDRVIHAFPENEQEEVRNTLSGAITAVISQVLMKKKDGSGVVAAFEIMIATQSIRAMIREKKTHMINSDIQTGAKRGMNLLDDHLLKLYNKDIISHAELISKAQDLESLKLKLK